MIRPASIRRFVAELGIVLVLAALAPGMTVAAETSFPFGHQLMLDVRPMKGSKRVPVIDIDDNGVAEIDLWCNTVQGQVVVANDTITIVTGTKTERECPPERAQGDGELLAALTQVTNWRRDGDRIELTGATTLQFRIPTN